MKVNDSQTARGSAHLVAVSLVVLLCALLALTAPTTGFAQSEVTGSDPTAHQYGDRVTEVEHTQAEHEETSLPARVVGTLPVTGTDLLVLATIAGVLVASGITLRRLATPGG